LSVLLPKLSKYLKINSNQFGYKKNTSCLLAATVVKEIIFNYTKKGSIVHAAVVVMSKAFDRINHKLLLTKLANTNMPPLLVNILYCMMTNTTVNVKFNNICGSRFVVGNGTRQGGCLSGLLFNFYINDIIDEIMETSVGCHIEFECKNIICYADDFILLSPSANGLQFLIDKLYNCLSSHSLKLNVEKSKRIVFVGKNRKKINFGFCIYVNGCKLALVKDCNYLGIVLSRDMSINLDVERACKSYLKQFYGMFSKFY